MFAEMLKQIQTDYDSLNSKIIMQNVSVKELMLPMQDGVFLKTYIFKADCSNAESGPEKMPVIMQRSPYFHVMELYKLHGVNLAKRGFCYVLQFCRGTGPSEGEWEPNVNERSDGLATLKWLDQQEWVESIGYWGDSYLALTGWCIADKLPKKVKGMYLGVYGTDRFTSAYEKGLFRHDVLTSWAMENSGTAITADYVESCQYRPHIEVDEKLWKKKLEWYRRWITATKEDDAYWQEGFWKMLRDMPALLQVPVLITEGWYDHHLGSALKSYEKLNPDIRNHSTLQIGCWNHYSMNCMEWMEPENLQNSEVKSMIEWFSSLLIDQKLPKKKIQIYIIGRDEWREYSEWPIAITEKKKYFLSDTMCDSEKNNVFLLSCKPPESDGQIRFTYDPNHPVPSLGAESMLKSMEKVGSLIQPSPGFRKDVVSFVSEPLKENLLVIGKIKVCLDVATDCEDTAFSVKVMEIKKDGRSVNIRSSITTISADNAKEYEKNSIVSVEIAMWDIAWEIKENSKIRIDISSSDFPQYSIHSNTKGIWSLQKESKIAHQIIYAGTAKESYVELPIV